MAVWCPEERPRGLAEHTVTRRTNLSGDPDTRVDIVDLDPRMLSYDGPWQTRRKDRLVWVKCATSAECKTT